jgi:hypothetical protein
LYFCIRNASKPRLLPIYCALAHLASVSSIVQGSHCTTHVSIFTF